MKRIRITAMCLCLLATLSTVGCICAPGYYAGMPGCCSGMPAVSCDLGNYGHGGVVFDTPCAPCGAEMGCGGGCGSCGVVEFAGDPCAPCSTMPCAPCPPIVNCRTSLSNISNGVLLIGRGVLDVSAAPFVIVGNLLSSGCQYEVIAHCPETHCGTVYQTIEPCGSVGSSGCDSCNNGYIGNGFSNGYIEETSHNGYHSQMMVSQPMPHRSHTVIQAAHREPITPGVRFVQPR